MSKTEGEYELVLGNRQLLSAFFIIVILFGVFFTMGYVVGKNSTPGGAPSNASAPAQRADAAPAATQVQPSASQPASAAPKEEAREAAPAESKAAETKPAETKPVETKPLETAAVKEPEKPRMKADAPRRSPAKAPPASAAAVAVNPGPGNMYLQVMAVGQPQAGVVMDTLKQKGFPVILGESPTPSLYRVMVGPYTDAASLGKAKAQLENVGFKPLVRK